MYNKMPNVFWFLMHMQFFSRDVYRPNLQCGSCFTLATIKACILHENITHLLFSLSYKFKYGI